jgi:hypothetical protein
LEDTLLIEKCSLLLNHAEEIKQREATDAQANINSMAEANKMASGPNA